VRGADSRVGGLTVDCNTRIHEGALQSEAPLSAQRWYASGAVFMLLRNAYPDRSDCDERWVPQDAIFCIEIAPERGCRIPFYYMHTVSFVAVPDSQIRLAKTTCPKLQASKQAGLLACLLACKATIVRGLRQCAGTTASKQGAQGVSCRSGCRFLPYALGRDDRIMMMIVELIVES